MKTATLPAIRVEPELREQIESVLDAGYRLSSFVEVFEATGISYSTEQVARKLRTKTLQRRKQLAGW